jgi:hypothetical protein
VLTNTSTNLKNITNPETSPMEIIFQRRLYSYKDLYKKANNIFKLQTTHKNTATISYPFIIKPSPVS